MSTLTEDNAGGEAAPQGASIVQFLRRALLVYLRPYWGLYALIVVCLFCALAFDIVFPLGITFLIDMAIMPQDGQMLALILGGLIGLFVVASLSDISYDFILARIGARLLASLRLKLFTHLQNLPAGYYMRAQSGDVIARFTNDLAAIETALTDSLPIGVYSVLRLVASVAVLYALDWRLSLIMSVLLPLTALAPSWFTRRGTQSAYRRKQDEAAIADMVQEYYGAQAVTRAFGLRDAAIARFARRMAAVTPHILTATLEKRMVVRSSSVGQFFVQVAILCIGAYQVFTGSLTVGELVGYVSLLPNVGSAASALASFFAEMIPGAAGLQRVEELLNEPPKVVEAPQPVELPRLSREVTFEGVDFSYTGERPNLVGVNLHLRAGQSVAFVGRSGSGKSTVLNLVMRFYDPDCGRVLLDGQDLRLASLNSLRAQMAVVFQDTFLFNTSVRENMRLVKADATDAEIEAAARAAEIHDLILALPQGYDTPVGERGGRLSGGQRQRLALARAILRDPAILLLDEATSALDPETEAAINGTLRRLARDRTILSVTHRLAPVADMDHIVVMERGQVAEQGTHTELLAQQGIYSQLWQQQSGFALSADGERYEVTPDRLRAIPLFASLAEPALADLAAHFVTEHFDAGRAVFAQGDAGDKFYIIVRGKLRITQAGHQGQEVELRVLQDGEYFGEIALLENAPRTATVTPLQPSVLLALPRGQFLKMLDDWPGLRAAVEGQALERSLRSIARTGPRRRSTPLLDTLIDE